MLLAGELARASRSSDYWPQPMLFGVLNDLYRYGIQRLIGRCRCREKKGHDGACIAQVIDGYDQLSLQTHSSI